MPRTEIAQEIKKCFMKVSPDLRVNRGDMKVCIVDTDGNTTDPLTKSFSHEKHRMHTTSMSMRYTRVWT